MTENKWINGAYSKTYAYALSRLNFSGGLIPLSSFDDFPYFKFIWKIDGTTKGVEYQAIVNPLTMSPLSLFYKSLDFSLIDRPQFKEFTKRLMDSYNISPDYYEPVFAEYINKNTGLRI